MLSIIGGRCLTRYNLLHVRHHLWNHSRGQRHVLQHSILQYLLIEHSIGLHELFHLLEHSLHKLQLKGLQIGNVVLRINLIHRWCLWRRKRDCTWLEKAYTHFYQQVRSLDCFLSPLVRCHILLHYAFSLTQLFFNQNLKVEWYCLTFEY
jgi:hypothetical protein